MRTERWRYFACGLAAASLGLTIAACDDQTGTEDLSPAPDFSVALDMTTGADMSAGPDMALPPGTGRIVLTEVQGTVYTDVGGAEAVLLADARQLNPIVVLPQFTVGGDYTSPGFAAGASQLVAKTIAGCTADRYTLPTDAPGADENAGSVTFTGYNASMAISKSVMIPTAVPATITCTRGPMASPYYGCFYGGGATTDAGANHDGASLGSVLFPSAVAAPFTAGMTDITATFAGGNGTSYTMTNQMTKTDDVLDFVKLVGIQVGTGTAQTALNAIGTLDGTKDVTITWACDGGNTAGSGCQAATVTPFDVIVLQMGTSKDVRKDFSRPPVTTKFGAVQCFASTGKGAMTTGGEGTLVVPKEAIATMLGTVPADNKSYQIGIVRVKVTPANLNNNGHTMFWGAGIGKFGFNNL
jgi:hypothetical protein